MAMVQPGGSREIYRGGLLDAQSGDIFLAPCGTTAIPRNSSSPRRAATTKLQLLAFSRGCHLDLYSKYPLGF